jgi:3'-phosphoadenosine 5'-phosphosulfate sulfotransferase (PAPS reductase)/FAD synthetase
VVKAAKVAAELPGREADGSAIRPEDYAWAQLKKHRLRVERAIDAIRRASEVGRIGASFSGGKDSTVVAHLVRSVVPDAPLAFFNSGDELPDTLEMVRAYGAEAIAPRLTMREMARYSGWWGYAEPVDRDCPFDAKRILIEEPSETFVVRRGLRVICHGVRAEESGNRARHIGARGELYQGADRTWYCMPIARWSLEDVWAYIASHRLRYHSAYDAMSAAGVPRESQRVAGLLGERGSGWGRHALLRMHAPEAWGRLVAEFPRLGLMG